MKPTIVVIGSSNTDMVIKTGRLPAPGETILGGTFFMNAGGKGANQAVAAARLNGAVTFITKTGTDLFGNQSIQLYKDEGIDTTHIVSDAQHPSGVALITVDEQGENCIVVAPGANNALTIDDINKADAVLGNASIILMQLEIPVPVVDYVAALAKKRGIQVVLNPAPACALSNDLLRNISIITPNKHEAEMLTGQRITDTASAKKAALLLSDAGIKTVIITLGAEGALVLHDDEFALVPAPLVTAVDTTAAGDVFNGALVVALSEGTHVNEAVAFANAAAALSVTKLGAQASAPYRAGVDESIKSNAPLNR